MIGDAQGGDRPLVEETLLAQAEEATGLGDWGDDLSFRAGLRVVINAVEKMAPPPGFRAQVRGRIHHLLTTRLRLAEDAREHPEILAGKVERPLVIVGLPRTGTTITYDLLALDPTARTPREWETMSPWPAPRLETFETDPRIAALNATYAALLARAPELAAIQRFDATQPGECNHIMMLHFAGPNFAAELSVPEHGQWVAEERAPGLYKTHKRVLQHLQWKGPRGRWTIKSPAHLLDLEGLLEVYPDACLIWTHRDPVATFSSLSSMFASFQKAFGVPVDPRAVGTRVSTLWSAGLARATASRRNPDIERRILDIPHRDVVNDPLGTAHRIHEHFALPFSAAYADAIALFLQKGASSKRLGRHKHAPEDYGLDAARIRRTLQDYYERFGEHLTY